MQKFTSLSEGSQQPRRHYIPNQLNKDFDKVRSPPDKVLMNLSELFQSKGFRTIESYVNN